MSSKRVSQKAIVFATCNKEPDFQASDAVVAGALSVLGATVTASPWNGDQAAFEKADLIVVRSTWDYPADATRFTAWLAQFAGRVSMVNSPGLMQWNISKVYLRTLAAAGAPLPKMLFIKPSTKEIVAAMEALELEEAVVKPVIGATASGLSLVRRDDPQCLKEAAAKLEHNGLVQPLIREITSHGETSLIYIDGEFTHAVVKRAKSGDIRVQSDFGGTVERIDPPAWAVEEARLILEMLPEAPTYARIDAVILDETLQLMEVEVIEPELFFTHAPEAADRFAAALMKKL